MKHLDATAMVCSLHLRIDQILSGKHRSEAQRLIIGLTSEDKVEARECRERLAALLTTSVEIGEMS